MTTTTGQGKAVELNNMAPIADEITSPDFHLVSEIDKEINDSPIEEVRLTVPTTDDPTLPCLTFRTWSIGLTSCIVLSFINQFFSYRTNQVTISSVVVQIVALPVGRMMAATLPTKPIKVPFMSWLFSLNPGPFNIKEHTLITILANAGAGGVYALGIVTIVKAFYHKKINLLASMLLSYSTQMLGYGWAGIFRKYLVDSPFMWWPSTLIQVSLFRALHEKEQRAKGKLTRSQFFVIFLVVSFAYFLVPNFFFPAISSLSFICWMWKDSVTAHHIGSGLKGLGVGSIGIDWSTISGFIGSPLASPPITIYNAIIGFSLLTYILIPISYWTNLFNAKRFPMNTSHLFDNTGRSYNISRVLNEESFSIDLLEYESYSDINISIFFVYAYGISFATLSATTVHVLLHHGSTIWQLWRRTNSSTELKEDVHARVMRRNYKSVPQWWFHVILVVVIVLSIFTCEGFGKQLQLPWWGILLACAMAFFFTLPVGVINATTNMQPALYVITELVIGYLYPGKPLASVTFKIYGSVSMSQALTFLSDFKMGHYMKIPPRSMFVAQIVGTLVATSVYFATCWWLLTSVPHICDASNLPKGSLWTCPGYDVFYSASIIWGVVGPLRMFGRLGNYFQLNWFFLVGALLPVPFWLLSRKFPKCKWLKLINFPVMLSASANMPPAHAVNYTSWIITGVIFNVWVFRKYKGWWARYNYVLSAALDAGIAFMAVLTFFSLGYNNIYSVDWWGGVADDYCPLAVCPTTPGSYVPEGCPVIALKQ